MKWRRHWIALPKHRLDFSTAFREFCVVKAYWNRPLGIPLEITWNNWRKQSVFAPLAAREYLVVGAPILLLAIQYTDGSRNRSSAQAARSRHSMFYGPVQSALLRKNIFPTAEQKGMQTLNKHYSCPPLTPKVFLSVRTNRSFRATFFR